MGKWRDRLTAISVDGEKTAKTAKTSPFRSTEGVIGSFGSNSTATPPTSIEAAAAKYDRRGAQLDDTYAPAEPCATCGLGMWWQRPDGVWVCAICPDPVKCRQCDRPRYSHESWPMACARWEPKA